MSPAGSCLQRIVDSHGWSRGHGKSGCSPCCFSCTCTRRRPVLQCCRSTHPCPSVSTSSPAPSHPGCVSSKIRTQLTTQHPPRRHAVRSSVAEPSGSSEEPISWSHTLKWTCVGGDASANRKVCVQAHFGLRFLATVLVRASWKPPLHEPTRTVQYGSELLEKKSSMGRLSTGEVAVAGHTQR